MGGRGLKLGRSARFFRGGLRRTAVVLVAIATGMAFLPPANAIEPPPELRTLCVNHRDEVFQAESPANCTNKERVVTVPDDRPVHWCIDPQERIFHSDSGNCGKRDRRLTIPDSGTIFVCSRNVQGGTELPRGEIRWVYDLSDCTFDETGYVTPAAPQAFDDTFEVGEDVLLEVPDRGVLDNDSDLTGAPLTARLIDDVATGALSLNVDGGFTYDGRGLFDHLDSGETAEVAFSYIANDGALDSNTAVASISILGANDRPIAGVDAYGTDEDTLLAVAAPGVLDNDSDADAHTLNARLLENPAAGSLDLAADGSFTFDPRGAFDHLPGGVEATATFTYVANDGTVDSDATGVAITVLGVNDPPAGGADTATTDENTELTLPRSLLLTNDSDADAGTTLTIVSATQPTDGTLRDEGDRFVFDPTQDADLDALGAGEIRTVTFTYQLSDGTTTVIVPVSIAVTGVSAPTAVDDTLSTDEDNAAELNVLANDDLQGGTLALPATTARGGTLTETGTPGVVRYQPPASMQSLGEGAADSDSFSYALHNSETDQDGAPSVGLVAISVAGVNDAPVASDQSYSLSPTAPLVVAEPDGLRDGSSDVDNDRSELIAVLVAPPSRGRLVLQPDGSFTFDPAGDFPEAADTTFAFRLSDGLAESAVQTVNLAVGTNAFPEIPPNQTFRTPETSPNGLLIGRIQVQDPDHADPDTHLTFDLVDSQGLAVTIEPNADADGRGRIVVTGGLAVGTYALTFDVTDDGGATTRGVVTVRIDPPLAANGDSYIAVGNTPLIAGGGSATGTGPAGLARVEHPDGVLANDGGAGPDVVVEAAAGSTDAGGAFEIFADGSFRYDPPVVGTGGWAGTAPLADGFAYTVVRYPGDPDEERVSARVELTVGSPVWYVDANAAAPGEGTSVAPFSSLAPIAQDAPDDPDAPGHQIFVMGAGRPAYSGPVGIALEQGQRLLGQPAGLVAEGITLIPATAAADAPAIAPRLGAAAGPAVLLDADNTLAGLIIDAPAGVKGTEVGAIDADLILVTTSSGPALDLASTAQAGGRVSVASIDASSGGTPAVALTGVSAAVTLAGVTVDTPSNAALEVAGTSGTVQIAALDGTAASVAAVMANTGSVLLGAVDVAASGALLEVSENAGTVSVTSLTAAGPLAGLVIEQNTGTIAIATADVTDVTALGVRALDNDGTISIADGAISASASAPGAQLVDSDGGSGRLEIGASLLLPASTAGPRSGHAVSVDGLVAAGTAPCAPGNGCVLVSGALQSDGVGVSLLGNDPGALVRFTGPVQITTAGTPAFRGVNAGTIELTNGPVNLSSTAAPALRIAGASIGALGARFDDVSGSGARSLPPSAIHTGATIDLSAIGSASGLPLHVLGGTISGAGVTSDGSRCDCAAVQLTAVAGVRIGDVAISGSNGDGLRSSASTDVVLAGTAVDTARGDGIVSTEDSGLVLDGATVENSDRRGIVIGDPVGQAALRNTTVTASGSTQVDISDKTTASGQEDVVVLESTSVSDGNAEHTNIVVKATDDPDDLKPAANLTLRTEGDLTSGSFGGGMGLDVVACAGARANVELSKFSAAGTAGDGIRLRTRDVDPGDTGCPADPASRLSFSLSGMRTIDGGGVNAVDGAGIRLVGSGPGTLDGTLTDIDVTATKRGGVHFQDVQGGVVVRDVTASPLENSGFLITKSSGLILRQVEVTGASSNHGIEMRHARDIRITESRVDLRLGSGDRPLRPLDPAEACMPPRASGFPYTQPEDAPLHAGIFGRHLGGSIVISDTVVRGGEFHEIVLANGLTIPNPDIDPEGTPAATLAETARETYVELSGLSLLDTHPGGAGALVMAGPHTGIFLALPGGGTPWTLDGPIVACAVGDGDGDFEQDGLNRQDGRMYTRGGLPDPGPGGPHLQVREGSDAYIAAAAGFGAYSDYDFYGIHVEYIRADGDATTGRAVRTYGVGHPVWVPPFGWFPSFPGIATGRIHSFTISNPPNTAFETNGSSDLLYQNGTIRDPDGPGFVIDGGERIELRNITIERSGDSGIVVRRAKDVVIAGTTVTQPAGHGLDAADADGLTVQGMNVTAPRGHGLSLWAVEDASVEGGTLDLELPSGADPLTEDYAGVFARHVGGASSVKGVSVEHATLDGVLLANGEVPGFDDSPYDPGESLSLLAALPTDGTVGLAGLTTSSSASAADAAEVVAGGGATLTVDLTGDEGTTDRPITLSAVENAAGDAGGALTVTGGHVLNRAGTGAAVDISANGALSSATMDLTNMDVRFPAATVAAPSGTGISLTATDGAALSGRMSASVADARGPGVEISSAGGLTIDGGTIDRPAGDGLRVTDSSGVAVSGVLVREPIGHGLYAWDVEDLSVAQSTFDLTTARDTNTDAADYSGVFARYVDGDVAFHDITVKAPTLHGITMVSGSSNPWFSDASYEPTTPDSSTSGFADVLMHSLEVTDGAGTNPAVLVGSAPGGSVDLDFGTEPAKQTTVDRPIRVEAAGGPLLVRGGHSVDQIGSADGVVFHGPGVDLGTNRLSVAFPGAGPANPAGRGIVLEDVGPGIMSSTSVSGAGPAAVDVTGGSSLTLRGSPPTVLAAGGPALRVDGLGSLCLGLEDVTAGSIGDTGFHFTAVGLDGRFPGESVGDWLTRFGNSGDHTEGTAVGLC